MTSWEKGRKRVWLEKDYGEWQMWGWLVENILSAQGEVAGWGLGGGGGHLERELMANSIQKTMRLDLPGGPAAKTSQLPLQVAGVPSLV